MPLATVLSDIAPIYERPSVESPRTDEVLYGMSIQLMRESDKGWAYVRTEWGGEGYMPLAYLERDPDVAAAWRKYKKVVVMAPYVDILKEPSGSAPRLVSVPRGGILVALGAADENGWQKLGLTAGAVGYTRASYVAEAITSWESMAPADVRWNIVETALSYNGVSYRAGGRSPMGIDAIGLASMSYLMNGIIIPRTIEFRQSPILHQIEVEKLDEGDLLYFENSIGVYIGDAHFVHSTILPGSDGVVVSSLRSKDEDYRGDLAETIVAAASIF